jgi:uncharacterized DUF497 family protein
MFDWDSGNIQKLIRRHRVTSSEAEESMADPDQVIYPAYSPEDERREAIIGTTTANRLLFVVYTMRGERFRVLSARDATRRERRLYERRQR